MVLTASESRKQARESLRGKWSIVILTFLLFTVYSTLVSFLGMIPFLGIIFQLLDLSFSSIHIWTSYEHDEIKKRRNYKLL